MQELWSKERQCYQKCLQTSQSKFSLAPEVQKNWFIEPRTSTKLNIFQTTQHTSIFR